MSKVSEARGRSGKVSAAALGAAARRAAARLLATSTLCTNDVRGAVKEQS